MNSNKLSRLFLAFLSSAVILQTEAFAFDVEQLGEREKLHRSVLASEDYQQAQTHKQEVMAPLNEKYTAFCAKLAEVSSPFDQKIRSLETALQISRDQRDSEIARLTQESNERLALECAPLCQQLAQSEAAFVKESDPFQAKILAILQKRQERSAFESKMGARQSVVLTYVDDLDSAMRTAEEDKQMAPFQKAIAALQQRYLNPLESAIESAESKRNAALDTQIELITEKHRELEAQITTVIQTLEDERNLKENALRESHAAFNDEINKRSAETYAAVNEAYHLAKRKLLPQYPLLHGFVDSADRVVVSSLPKGKATEEKKEQPKTPLASSSSGS